MKNLALIISAIAMAALAGCSWISRSPFAKPEPVLEAGAPFGAIAYSDSTQNWQVVSDHPSRAVARKAAIAGCSAGDCRLLAEFSRGQCASFSLDAAKATNAPFVAVTDDSASTLDAAKLTCSEGGGKDCKASPPICN